jgi:CTP synthase
MKRPAAKKKVIARKRVAKSAKPSSRKIRRTPKFVFISGGVISGIGKGVTSASISAILLAQGYSVSSVKVDMYLNQDAGTIRPQEHGEVFVTDDGIETDQDLGNYERFTGVPVRRDNYITTGQIYAEVLRKERAFEYDGEDVEAIPHVTNEIIRRWNAAAKQGDIVLIELGGTVGEYQNGIFFEASRLLKLRHPHDVAHIHVAYLPIPSYLGEMKTKPVQQSVRMLNSMGIEPDIIVGRAEHPLDERRKQRVALFCNVEPKAVLSNPDVSSIYEIPVILDAQHAGEIILEKLGLERRGAKDMRPWKTLVRRINNAKEEIKVAVVGKYFGTGNYELSDSYISVIEALKHGSWANGVKPKLTWVDAQQIEEQGADKILSGFGGVVVPGGFGSRGTEGMIQAVRYAREKSLPYLGLCYGMQMATVEFARNVAKLRNANSTEIEAAVTHPVIHIMPDQEKKMLDRDYGASMRLGAWACLLAKNSLAEQLYGTRKISERHRHRYELNNEYRERLENAGLRISGNSPDGTLAEIIELPNHPFFIAVQFHPEFKSQPMKPHPLFAGFTAAVKKFTKLQNKLEQDKVQK